MTTLIINYERIKRISLLTLLLIVSTILVGIFNAHLPNHMQVAFVQTCEARSDGDRWRDFFRREFEKVIKNEFDGVRKLRDTRYDILSHNMWERNKWETDSRYYKVMAQNGALVYNGQYVQYANPDYALWSEKIKNIVLSDRGAAGLSGGVSYHEIPFTYSGDRKIIETLCNTPGSPYRIVKKGVSKVFTIVFDPSLLM